MSYWIFLIAFLLAVIIFLILTIDLLRWLYSKILFHPLKNIGSIPDAPYHDRMININNGFVVNTDNFMRNRKDNKYNIIYQYPLSQYTGLYNILTTIKNDSKSADEQNEWINIWHFNQDPSKPTILFCHGNYGNITHRSYIIEFCLALQINLLVFDYRGYGKSTSYPTIEHLFQDGNMAYNYLLSYTTPDKIIIWGESLGGCVAIKIATDNTCSSLVLHSTFSTLDDIIYFRNPHNIISQFMKMCLPIIVNNIPNSENIKKITCPIAVLHSIDDEIIPYCCARKNYENITSQKKIFINIKGKHTKPIMNKETIEQLLEFCSIEKNKDFSTFVDPWLKRLTNFVNTIEKDE